MNPHNPFWRVYTKRPDGAFIPVATEIYRQIVFLIAELPSVEQTENTKINKPIPIGIGLQKMKMNVFPDLRKVIKNISIIQENIDFKFLGRQHRQKIH